MYEKKRTIYEDKDVGITGEFNTDGRISNIQFNYKSEKDIPVLKGNISEILAVLTGKEAENSPVAQIIERVDFQADLTGPGDCDMCKKSSDKILQIAAEVHYKNPVKETEQVSKWFFNYCVWCLGKMTETLPEDQIEGYE